MARKRKTGRTLQEPKKTKLKQIIDPVLARALSHPLRSHILATLGDRIVSPSEIARELGVNARDLSYHFKVLVEIGMIKLVRTEKRRGSLEHFYDINSRVAYLDDEMWQRMPAQISSSFSANLLQLVVDDAVEALRAGTFNSRDNHHSRVPMILDERGRREVLTLMDETLERMLRIRKACSGHRTQGSRECIPMEVFMISFETAAGVHADRGRPRRNLGRPVSTRSTRRRGRRSGRASAR